MSIANPWGYGFMGFPMAGMAEHLPDPPTTMRRVAPTPLELYGVWTWCDGCQSGGRSHDRHCWVCGRFGFETFPKGPSVGRAMTMRDLLGDHDLEPIPSPPTPQWQVA